MRPARRRQHDHRLIRAGNRFYAPPPSNEWAKSYKVITDDLPPRPAWLRLGAYVAVDGQRLGIISIRPTAAGGWELLGHLTCNRWYDAGEVTPL